MSAAQKGKKVSNETRQKMSAAQKNRVITEDAKQKISETLKEYFKTHTVPNKGKKMLDEFGQRVRYAKACPIKCVETNLVFLSKAEASRLTGIGREYLCHAILDPTKTAGKNK